MTVLWRLQQVEKAVDLKADKEDVRRLEAQMSRLTAAFYTLAVGIVLAAVTFAFAVAQLH